MIVLQSTYTAASEEVAALRSAHLAWLDRLIAGRIVIAAGRLADGSGAAILGAGDDAQALLRHFDDDPYVAGGVATYAHVVTFPAAMGGDTIKHLDAGTEL